MKEDWTKQMKQKLEGHQMEPPVGLWEGISREMATQSAPVVSSKTSIIRRWYWAAAAAVLAVVGFFAFYHVDESQAPQLVAKSSPQAGAPMLAHAAAVSINKVKAIEESQEVLQQTSVEEGALPAIQEGSQPAVEENVQPAAVEDVQPAVVGEPKEPQQHASAEPKQTSLPEVVDPSAVPLRSADMERWTLGLSGSNGLLAASNDLSNQRDNMLRYLQDAPSAYLNSFQESSLLQTYADNQMESKHKVPIRIGLSLQYQLTDRLALLSGISYSYLESEFVSPLYANKDYTQKLTYLGVPLGVSWKLWSSGGFGVYLTGGTLIEKCVDSKVSQGEAKARPWQLSLNASAGAEYHFTPQLGVYLEPSLGYYFDDGSSLEHYYKEHPLAPSLQFGLRLHLK